MKATASSMKSVRFEVYWNKFYCTTFSDFNFGRGRPCLRKFSIKCRVDGGKCTGFSFGFMDVCIVGSQIELYDEFFIPLGSVICL